VFVDESGFQLNMTPSYAYAPKGARAYGRVPKNRGENTSLLAAVSLDEGVSAAMTLTGAVDGAAFICSHECTFCGDCSADMDHVCPNCGGELVRRPRRETA